MTDTKPHTSSATNPFFAPFDETEAIPFSRITEADYLPAIKRGIELHSAEIDAIADNPDEPTVDNTLLPLEYGGADLTRVVEIMGPMTSAMSTDTLMSIDAEATPLLAAHSTEVSLNEKLWHRIRSLYDRRHSLGLDAPTMRLLTDCYLSFTRNGALLEGADRERFKELSASLADLSRRFGENLVLEMRDLRLTGTDRAELSGIPEHITGQVTDTPDGGWSLAVSQPVFMEVMRTADNRELRRRLYRLYSGRNFHTAHDNTAILSEIAALRREKASLLGYPTYAHFALAQRMAATPDRVMKLLNDLRDAYRPALAGEMESLRRIAGHDIEPWDYSYYAQKLKAADYDFDENAMKPYLELSNVTKGVLHMASLLYGIRFDEITGEVDTYHPDVRVYRVSHPDRGTLGLLYLDFFARPTKQPGAWMTEFRGQMQRPDGTPQRPYVTLVTNFVRPADGEPCLLRPS
ncbi:MAG: peptidase M3, partial [Paramuribaculum sp.]|nr:peptidase M3 [Paramuribaculum sp.]